MWIVALALRRPYTFVVMAVVILILTPITILRTPTDIFPDIDIPVVSVVWFYSGMSPQDMADRIVANSERGITTTVNDIEHMESQSVYGLGVIKVFFRPGTSVQGAIAQITAICQTVVRTLPRRRNELPWPDLFARPPSRVHLSPDQGRLFAPASAILIALRASCSACTSEALWDAPLCLFRRNDLRALCRI
jgi:hypothetical protein